MATLLCLALGSCAASAAQVHEAKSSGYRADFAVVYSAALAAVRERYPRLREDPVMGLIETAWHPVSLQGTSSSNDVNQVSGQNLNGATSSAGNQLASNTDPLGKSYFVRIKVRVRGGDPWRVTVTAEASSLRPGDVATPLRGADVPPWLNGREEALYVEIHQRLKRFAERLPEETVSRPSRPKRDSISFPNLPQEAAELATTIYRAAAARDIAALRATMVENFVWSSDEDPSADLAVLLWQADNSGLQMLSAALKQGCVLPEVGGDAVLCTIETPGKLATVQLSRIAGQWKFSHFQSR